MLGDVTIRTYRRREDMGVHAFSSLIAQFRFIVVNICRLIPLLSTDNRETGEKGYTFPTNRLLAFLRSHKQISKPRSRS
jgi:hypothetical protein